MQQRIVKQSDQLMFLYIAINIVVITTAIIKVFGGSSLETKSTKKQDFNSLHCSQFVSLMATDQSVINYSFSNKLHSRVSRNFGLIASVGLFRNTGTNLEKL